MKVPSRFSHELEMIVSLVEQDTLTNTAASRVKRDTEKHKRNVQREFSYMSVKDFILPDEADTAEGAAE